MDKYIKCRKEFLKELPSMLEAISNAVEFEVHNSCDKKYFQTQCLTIMQETDTRMKLLSLQYLLQTPICDTFSFSLGFLLRSLYNFIRKLKAIKDDVNDLSVKLEDLKIYKAEISKEKRYEEIVKRKEKAKKKRNKKKKKVELTDAEKEYVWSEFNRDLIGNCYVGCGRVIDALNFECGHVIAESKNGSNDLSNLRPICKQCNDDMKNQSMIDYANEYYPDKTRLNEEHKITVNLLN